MKKLILTAVIIVLGLNVGCRLGCTPYDNCGPVYSNPYNCAPNYRSGSVFNGAMVNQGEIEYAPADAAPATTPATTKAPAATQPAPSASPAPLPTTSYNKPVYRTNQQSFQTTYRAQYQQR